jgi:hypothetical protein
MAVRTAAVTAASSSSVRSIVGMVERPGCGDGSEAKAKMAMRIMGRVCHQKICRGEGTIVTWQPHTGSFFDDPAYQRGGEGGFRAALLFCSFECSSELTSLMQKVIVDTTGALYAAGQLRKRRPSARLQRRTAATKARRNSLRCASRSRPAGEGAAFGPPFP